MCSRLLYFFLFLFVMACHPPLKLNEDQLIGARSSAKALKSQSLVVRIPTQGRKINALRETLNNPKIDDKSKIKYSTMLEEAINSDKEYLSLLADIFKARYDITPVFFVPDSSYRAFKSGSKDVFIDENGVLISNQKIIDDYLLLLTDESPYKFKLYNKEGKRLSKPMPHKRDAFLPFLKVWLDKENYMADQIIFFNDRLTEILRFND